MEPEGGLAKELRAIQLQRIVRDCGLRIPEDVALLGVDNEHNLNKPISAREIFARVGQSGTYVETASATS